MRILCITGYYKPAYVYGGPIHSVSMLCEELVRSGVQVTVSTTGANGSDRSLDISANRPVNVDGVQVRYFARSWPSRWVPFYAPALGRACRMYVKHFDIVYICATWTYPMFAAARAAQAANVPYVVSPMGSFMTQSLKEKWLKKRLYLRLIERGLVNRAAAIRCTSVMEKRQMEHLSFRPPRVVIPEGVDLVPFSTLPTRGKFRKPLELPSRARLSIFVGRLAPEKRIALTIEAFVLVARQLPEAHLAIVGPEAGSGHIARQRAEALQVSERVHFLGLLRGSELLQAYADADLLVLLSRRENFGMVAVEAMAAGLPVLLSDAVGLGGQVDQAKAGRVVAVDAPVDEIARAWHYMLTTADLEAMGARGRVLVRDTFSQEAVSAQMLDLFARICDQSPKTRSKR